MELRILLLDIRDYLRRDAEVWEIGRDFCLTEEELDERERAAANLLARLQFLE